MATLAPAGGPIPELGSSNEMETKPIFSGVTIATKQGWRGGRIR